MSIQVLWVKDSNGAMYLFILVFGHVIRGQTRSNDNFFLQYLLSGQTRRTPVLQDDMNDDKLVVIHFLSM